LIQERSGHRLLMLLMVLLLLLLLMLLLLLLLLLQPKYSLVISGNKYFSIITVLS